MEIYDRKIGPEEPVYIISEIGLNHGGNIETALDLIEAASHAKVDAVKFQKRLLPGAIPEHMRNKPKVLQDGSVVTYLEYKRRMEFDYDAYRELANYAHGFGLDFGVSVWDTGTPHILADMEEIDFLKLPSAMMSNEPVVHHTATRGLPFFWSTGMHTMEEILITARWIDDFAFDNWGVFHCHSAYPAPVEELNLAVISEWTKHRIFNSHPIGYSGHEVGLVTTAAAVALGASVVERHITLDRASWGSDQSASVEPGGFERLVRDIRTVETAIGDGRKRMWDSEQAKRDSLTY